MKTYAFHSYKGGSGRTLALANFACFLRDMKQSVVMIDLDFDAPGLPIKFGVYDEVRGGYCSYLKGFSKADRAQDLEREERVEFIRNYLIDIKSGHDDNKPRLSLLPVGDTARVGYWQQLASEEFHELFATSSGRKTRRTEKASAESNETLAAFDLDLDIIREAAGDPDYCLVDCRSARDSVALPMLRWADHVVEFFHCNREGVFGALLIQKILASSRLRTKSVEFTPVVTRVPYATSLPNVQRQLDGFLKEFSSSPVISGVTIPLNKLQFLSEQRELETREFIALRELDRGRYPLTFGYLSLFYDLIGMVDEGEKSQALIALKLNPGDQIFERFFEYAFNLGELLNVDHKKNVAFRRDTLTELMNSLAKDQEKVLAQNGIDAERGKKEIELGFEQGGKRAGENFGKEAISIPEVWMDEKIPATTLERLEQWCKFDTDAGFGKWTPTYNPETGVGAIKLENHFLQNVNGDIGLAFLRGYVRGVLSYLVGTVGSVARITIIDSPPSDPPTIRFHYEGEDPVNQ